MKIMQKTPLATLDFWKIFTQHPGLMYLTGGERSHELIGGGGGVRGQGQKLGLDN